jgi:hypothetical protein
MSKRSTNLNRGHKSARLSASNLLGLMDALGISADEQRGIAERAVNASRKAIRYDDARRDFEMRLDGELVGYARTFSDGDRTLDELIASLGAHAA